VNGADPAAAAGASGVGIAAAGVADLGQRRSGAQLSDAGLAAVDRRVRMRGHRRLDATAQLGRLVLDRLDAGQQGEDDMPADGRLRLTEITDTLSLYIRTARARVSASYLRRAGTVSVSLREQSLCQIQDGSERLDPCGTRPGGAERGDPGRGHATCRPLVVPRRDDLPARG
jgi:hypothetical protein